MQIAKITHGEWFSGKKPSQFDTEGAVTIHVSLCSLGYCFVDMLDADMQAVRVYCGGPGTHHFRAVVTGYAGFVVGASDLSGKPCEYSARVKIGASVRDEPRNDLPPEAPRQPSNALARIRQAARAQLGVMREFAYATHELPDDDDGLFEEEIVTLAKQKSPEAESKAPPKPSDSAGGADPTTGATTLPENEEAPPASS